jgi:hypothetical protein
MKMSPGLAQPICTTDNNNWSQAYTYLMTQSSDHYNYPTEMRAVLAKKIHMTIHSTLYTFLLYFGNTYPPKVTREV